MPSSSQSLNRHFPKKHLGQNFLIDHNVLRKIIENCQLKKEDTVLEIGPGKGALTEQISPFVKKIVAVETDASLVKSQNEHFAGSNVEIVHHDILQFPFEHLPEKVKLIGNLPYNIATPIIEKMITYRQFCSVFYCMVQWEVGLRLCAKPGTKDYGSLSCFVQYYTQPKILFNIKNTSFKPAPKIQSCFMELKILEQPALKAMDENLLFKITRTAFQQRRKTLSNALSVILNKDILLNAMAGLKISPQARAEDLTLENFILLSNELKRFT